MKEKDKHWRQGFADAIAIMVRLSGGYSTTEIEEAYSCNFMTVRQLKASEVDDYDIQLLKPVIKEIEGRKKRMSNHAHKKLTSL